ncbi:hypothetical protein ACAW74_00695 [Fibrella sp. WM1]|uniref:hypothetical protein n=1 Tax=Fibrella musci TaxID=3242485 RepID=UPI003522F3AD
MSFSSLLVRFQSAGMIPPPYTHFYTLLAKPVGNRLSVEFAITYTDREELDEEDITGEGFTLNDDFSWSGQLGEAWLPILRKLLDQTKLDSFNEADLGEQDDFVEVTIEPSGGTPSPGTPTDPEPFLYAIQELIQAIYEAGGKEKPFELIYLNYNRAGDLELRLNASFAERSVRLMRYQNRQEKTRQLPWETLQQVMSTIYAYDYNPEDSLPRPPKRDGQYLNLGGDEWYDVTPLTAVQKALEQL